MKKIFAIIALAFVATFPLVGCGSTREATITQTITIPYVPPDSLLTYASDVVPPSTDELRAKGGATKAALYIIELEKVAKDRKDVLDRLIQWKADILALYKLTEAELQAMIDTNKPK